MKINRPVLILTALVALSSCATDDGPVVFSDEDHSVSFGGALSDSEPLTQRVSQKLKTNGQTVLARIQVSAPSSDTIKLSGAVDTDAVRQEAERLAYQVEGVRFVINNLNIR